jgi:hypothetical protein
MQAQTPSSPEAKDRYQFITTVKSLTPISRAKKQRGYNAGDSWLNSMDDSEATPLIEISDLPDEQADLFHCKVRVLNGKAEGKEAAIDTMQNGVIHISNPLAAEIHGDVFPGLAIGDQIMLDNSDYLAMMTIQRHQVPDRSFKVYDMYRNADGTPKYPAASCAHRAERCKKWRRRCADRKYPWENDCTLHSSR